jgi:hypothetical protein
LLWRTLNIQEQRLGEKKRDKKVGLVFLAMGKWKEIGAFARTLPSRRAQSEPLDRS